MQQHHFIWYDLMTPDVAGSKKFYEAVAEWSVIPSSIVEAGGYFVLSKGELEFGGMMPTPPEAAARNVPPHWGGYIYVENVDAHTQRVVELGGRILREPWDIQGACRVSVVADPWGAAFNLMQPLGGTDGPERGDHMTPGNIGWHELMTGDLDRAWEFYSTLFGWQKTELMDMGDMGPYQMFGFDGEPSVGGMMKIPEASAQQAPPPSWNYYINIPDIQIAAKRIAELGGTIMMGPQEVPGPMWVIVGRDPQGAVFSLVAPK